MAQQMAYKVRWVIHTQGATSAQPWLCVNQEIRGHNEKMWGHKDRTGQHAWPPAHRCLVAHVQCVGAGQHKAFEHLQSLDMATGRWGGE